jgi:serine/threonine-protein kinase
MGLLDKLQSLLGGDKTDIAMRFELLSEGFVGTMSRFHKARDRKHDRIVGLKLCDPEKTSMFETRFAGLKKPPEGQIAMSLRHPRIVETYEFGVSTKGQNFIVMEYLNGPGLQLLVRQQEEQLVGKRVPLILQMAEALLAVHTAGYIHRDICPRNFICAEDLTSLKLIDFGLTLPDEPAFRQPGNRTGTPMYMAPEIVRRRATDRRVDVFAFGVTAYELLTFRLPWPHADPTGQGALKHDTEAPVPILQIRPQLNQALAETIMDCLEADRERRPRSMEIVVNRLRRIEGEQ